MNNTLANCQKNDEMCPLLDEKTQPILHVHLVLGHYMTDFKMLDAGAAMKIQSEFRHVARHQRHQGIWIMDGILYWHSIPGNSVGQR